MVIYCCGCRSDIDARLTNGSEVYSHRKDLHSLPFWFCDDCGNFVGCHHKTRDPTRPLGCIPTAEIKSARQRIHRILDPIWRLGVIPRKKLYGMISDKIGRDYHTAEIRTIEDAMYIYKIISDIKKDYSAN